MSMLAYLRSPLMTNGWCSWKEHKFSNSIKREALTIRASAVQFRFPNSSIAQNESGNIAWVRENAGDRFVGFDGSKAERVLGLHCLAMEETMRVILVQCERREW